MIGLASKEEPRWVGGVVPSIFASKVSAGTNFCFTLRALKPARAMHAAGYTEHSEHFPCNPIYSSQDFVFSLVKQRAANTATGAAPE
jgi:hypothetical protein